MCVTIVGEEGFWGVVKLLKIDVGGSVDCHGFGVSPHFLWLYLSYSRPVRELYRNLLWHACLDYTMPICLPGWVLGNSPQEINRAIKSSTSCCPATTGAGGAGSILSVPSGLDMMSLISDLCRGADVAWLLVWDCPSICWVPWA